MVGTARKNENSAAALLVSFCCIPPMIDAALRLTPGTIARHCHIPIINAFVNETCRSDCMRGRVNNLSTKSKTMPPAKRAMATVVVLSNNASIFLENKKPRIKAGITPAINFK